MGVFPSGAKVIFHSEAEAEPGAGPTCPPSVNPLSRAIISRDDGPLTRQLKVNWGEGALGEGGGAGLTPAPSRLDRTLIAPLNLIMFY